VSRRDFAMILSGIAAIYLPLSLFPAPDVRIFLIPWLRQISETGLSVPVGNYSPPYLYLVALFSWAPLPEFVTIKLLSIVGAVWLAGCVGRLVKTLGRDPLPAAAVTLLLPTVSLNGPVLGQADTFWTGCCVLAVAEALKDRSGRVALWAGAAFAFKAQAAFLAPFCLGFIVKRRAWLAFALPPLIYFAAIVPALLAGWPLSNLLTIYVQQAQITFLGDAPNLWAIPRALGLYGPGAFPLGYVLAAVAAAFVVTRRGDPLLIALLSAALIPFLLPKMLERFFFLADVLAFALAYARRDRFSISVAAMFQAGSSLSIIAYLMTLPWLNALASLPIGVAVYALISASVKERQRSVSAQAERLSCVTEDALATSLYEHVEEQSKPTDVQTA
jgi:hypothetical protein